jgi:hypothetical protein
VKFEEGIVVNIIVEPLRTHTKACNNLAAVEGLFCTRDCTAFNQVDNPVAEHLGMDAEVFFVFQKFSQGLRNATYAALNSAAVFDKSGDILTDTA